MAKQKQVLVAVPHETVRKGVCAAFAEEPNIVLHEAITIEALKEWLREQKFDLVVVHQSLVTDITILPRGRFVLLVSEPDMEMYSMARLHSVRAYLSQNAPSHFLRDALHLPEGGFLADAAACADLVEYLSRCRLLLVDESVLTARELDVFDLFWQGLHQAEIARKLNLSPSTVRVHITNIYKKLKMNPNQAKIILIPDDQEDE